MKSIVINITNLIGTLVIINDKENIPEETTEAFNKALS